MTTAQASVNDTPAPLQLTVTVTVTMTEDQRARYGAEYGTANVAADAEHRLPATVTEALGGSHWLREFTTVSVTSGR